MAARPVFVLEWLREHEAAMAEADNVSKISGMSEAELAARRRRKATEEARAGGHSLAWRQRLERKATILDFDPKQHGEYYNRLVLFDLSKFDLDEEYTSPNPSQFHESCLPIIRSMQNCFFFSVSTAAPLRPMRFTDEEYGSGELYLSQGLNILSMKIASSDVGFPIHVCGTVIARDCLDRKCLYLFHRDRDHAQLINSNDESLILTGPKRGFVLIADTYVELDLKIKDHEG